mgnify:CR=1 FL=1
MTYDTIIRNGRWFDGTGAPSALRNIGIRDGRIAAVTPHALDETGCAEVVDATGKWVLPGMVDVHTHYDVEVLGGPGLPESVRHGVTTVLVGSCSLSTIHVGGVDAAGAVPAASGAADVVRRRRTTGLTELSSNSSGGITWARP